MITRRRFLAGSAALATGACSGSAVEPLTSEANPDTAPTTLGADLSTTSSITTPSSEAPSSEAAPTTTATDSPFSPEPGTAPFGLGVASGDPTSDGFVLWTRLVDGSAGNPVADGEAVVSWAVAQAPTMNEPVASGTISTNSSLGHSVHVVVKSLEADSIWYYQFEYEGSFSPVGRTRTFGGALAARLVVASCQHYEDGHFGAWRHAVGDNPDLIVHVGDAIYTRAGLEPTQRSHGSQRPTDLDSFRRRYALYWAEPDLQLAHASAPWCSVWDDNEVVSNYAANRDQRGETTAEFAATRAAAYAAWWEHHPVRTPPPDDTGLEIHRRVHLGPAATLWLLDGRQFRSAQVCDRLVTLPAIERCDDVDDAARTMLGPEQEQWLEAGLTSETSTWQLVAQQTVVADFGIELGGTTGINNDQWDGYGPARDRLLTSLSNKSAVVLSGDIHAGAITKLRLGGDVVANEIVTPSISSKIDPLLALGLALTVGSKPDVVHFDATNHGYVLLHVDADQITAEFRHVDAATLSGTVTAGPIAIIDRDANLTLA